MTLRSLPVSSQYVRVPHQAVAEIQGGPLAANLRGYVVFTDVPYGTDVFIEVSGLPPYQPARHGESPIGPISFHLHENGVCTVGDPNAADAVGKAVILHQNPDDYRSQPAGNAGKRLACGVVQAMYR